MLVKKVKPIMTRSAEESDLKPAPKNQTLSHLMKYLFTTLIAAVAMAICHAGDSTTTTEYLELQQNATLNGNRHNADVYGQLAIMRDEAEGYDDYDWSDFNKLKATLKNKGNKPFKKGAVQFFKASSTSDELNVCYVIDFSLSLKGKKERILRNEFAKSIEELPEDTNFASYFFAGPVWLPGDKITIQQKKKLYQVKHHGVVVNWKANQVHAWESDIPTATATWRPANHGMRTSLIEKIKKQELVWGTDWSSPLKVAMNMEPKPDVIYFMTDGSCNTAKESAIEAAEIAQEKGIRINTIAMMHPQAEKPMQYLAAKSGGDFVIIDQKGECQLHEAGSVKCPKFEEHGKKKSKSKKKKKNK